MPFLLPKSYQLLFISSILLLVFHLPTAISVGLRDKSCEGTSNYTTNSTFATNLNFLLSYLSSNTSLTGFSNWTIGEKPNRIFGFALCRGDTGPDPCHECLNTASQELVTDCFNRSAYIWYDRCFLRYSIERLLPSYNNTPTVALHNVQDAPHRDRFNRLMYEMMNDLVSRTAFGTSKRMYATNETSFEVFQTLYGLMECSSFLSRNECSVCLKGAIGQISTCCGGKQGGRVLGPNCNLRYEVYKFYDDLAVAPAPTSPSFPPTLITPTYTTALGGRQKSSRKVVATTIPIASTVLLISAITIFWLRRKSKFPKCDCGLKESESVQFGLETIRAATDNFSEDNKLGEGGFGAVFKGMLPNGQEIAVKRLSHNSGQGSKEFQTEVELIAKLEHRNLVRLLGGVDGQEKILIYEYVPNASLDKFLFDPLRRACLDWERRYKIILGIARGLLYLHEDSRLRIIHRDLKASNILLDREMNPKISDFGTAKIFGVDQTRGNTNRITGTFGYMAPEYAMQGNFSVKSDIFSFGVLVLEILTGKKSSSFYQSDASDNILSYAWKHWKKGTILELIDPDLHESCPRSEVMRCIQIALLCAQEDVGERPTVSSVLLMLNSNSDTLPSPLKPAFIITDRTAPDNISQAESRAGVCELPGVATIYSVNEVTITELEPR